MCYICKEKFEDKHVKNKKIEKLGTIAIIQGNTELLHKAYAV